MIDPIQALLERGLDSFEPFPSDSRYYGLPIAEHVDADGRRIRYVRRRFLPPASAQTTVGEHVVTSSDRPDLVAARHLGNAELSWRVCDANAAMRPADLTETPGRRLRIALPAANPVPGA
jgi:hypothetical protein